MAGRVCSLAVLLPLMCAAQTNVGQIAGRITDSSSALVPGARILLNNPATGQSQEAASDENGLYIFPSLPRGTYRVRVEAQGFRPAEQDNVVLDSATRRAVDFTLEVGAVTEAIVVSAAAEVVKTTQGDVSQTITERQLSQIALNGRNYSQMLRLIPGSMATGMDSFGIGLSTTGQRVNGIRSNSLYFTMDGADNMDNGGNSNAIVNPNVDAIAEIKVLTASYSAEFGGRSGAMVNVVTKSGTQKFNGTLFHFVRNNVWDARSFFAQTMPPLRFNNFGWTLGGPLYIPGKFNTGKNKLFFFAAQEWKYTRQGVANVSLIPTTEERAGNFQNSSLPAPVDPFASNAPFPNRVIPANRFSANGPKLMSPYPTPNFGGPGGNYSVNGSNRTDTREDLVRIDYYLSQNNQMSYRWTKDTWDIWNAFQGGATGIVPGGRPRPGYTTMLNLQSNLSPTMLNYVSFSATQNNIRGNPQNQILSRQALGLTYPELFPVNEYQVGPNLSIAGFTGYTVGDRIRNLNTTFQVRDDFTKIVGAHTFKFGAQITRSRKDQNTVVTDNGAVTFNTSARNTSRNVIGDVLLGNFLNYSEGQQDTGYFARFNQFEFYAQDNWRVARNLTLDLGVRYSIYEPIYSALGNFTTFIPQRFNITAAPQINPSNGNLVPGTGDPYNGIFILGSGWPEAARGRIPQAFDPALDRLFSDLPRGSYPTRFNNLGPRIGVAFDPFGQGRTSIRAGLGVFFDLLRTDSLGGSAGNPPFQESVTLFDGNIDAPGGGATRAGSPTNLSFMSTNQNQPATYSYNFNVQHQFSGNVLVDAGYVGTMGRRLTRTLNLNQLRPGTRLNSPNSSINANALRTFPGYANLNMQENGDTSNYHSLQLSVSRRMARGLQFGVNYTYSKTMDSTSGGPQDIFNTRADYGLSSIHRAQVLNFNYVWEVPFLRRHQTWFVRNIIGNWDLSGITSFQSGAPFSVSVPSDIARIGVGSSRASIRPGESPSLPASERTLTRWFNAEGFMLPNQMIQGQFGNTGRNILIGPGFSQWDVALLKNFELGERSSLQFRAESFNLPNHASFTGINTTARFDSQGLPSQNYGAVTSSGPGRMFSFGLKLLF
jgi:hypothetical protein